MNVHVVGSGISGCTAARLLADSGHRVTISETRNHIGGNCYDELRDGVRMHVYGPHLFHTNDKAVWDFLSRFTEWSGYRHAVVADTRLGRISIPYNAVTEAQIGRCLSDEEIRDLVFVDYSEKQWGVPWNCLPAAITNRVPTRRRNADTRYFTDAYQGQPADGFAAMFERMLEGIPVHLGVGSEGWRRHAAGADLVVWTGRIDEFFGFRFGRLPFRSLRFEHSFGAERLGHAVINQCNRLPWTRVYDHRSFSEETQGSTGETTILTREYPCECGRNDEPYYPMPFGEGMEVYQKYRSLTGSLRKVVFLGRLATYCYLDMWMAVAQAMAKLRPLTGPNCGSRGDKLPAHSE